MHLNRWLRLSAWMLGTTALGLSPMLYAATSCTVADDCAALQTCAGGVCLHVCAKDSDCGADQLCDPDGFCLPDSCDADSECLRADFICREEGSRCIPIACRYDEDCLKGELCLDEVCTQDPTLYVQGGTTTCQNGGAFAGGFLAVLLAALFAKRRRHAR